MAKIENRPGFADEANILHPYRYTHLGGRWAAVFPTVTESGERGAEYHLQLCEADPGKEDSKCFTVAALQRMPDGRVPVYHGEEPIEGLRSVQAAAERLAAVMESRGERVGVYEPTEPEAGIEPELRLCRNHHGPLDEDAKEALRAVYEEPSTANWERAYPIMVSAEPSCTLWGAVLAVDRYFPDRRSHNQPWPEIPTRAVIREALHYATHDHARSLCDSVTTSDGHTYADMTLAPGYDIFPDLHGEAYVRRTGIRHDGRPKLYNAEEAALCGAAHFYHEEWGKLLRQRFLGAYPEARRTAIQARFADEAKAALSAFDLPLRDYRVEVTIPEDDPPVPADGARYTGEIRARVDLTHSGTGAAISLTGMYLCPATGEAMTPAGPDHDGTATMLFI